MQGATTPIIHVGCLPEIRHATPCFCEHRPCCRSFGSESEYIFFVRTQLAFATGWPLPLSVPASMSARYTQYEWLYVEPMEMP